MEVVANVAPVTNSFDEPIISFLPAQIVVLVECIVGGKAPSSKPAPTDIVARTEQVLAALGVDTQSLQFSADRVVVLAGRTRTLATLTIQVPNARDNVQVLYDLVRQINQAVGNSTPRASASDLTVDVRLASFNWLGGGAPHNGGTGGPGAWPIATTPASGTPWALTFPNEPAHSGSGNVVVAVLDTAPPFSAIQNAYTNLVQTNSHPLLSGMLGSSSPTLNAAGDEMTPGNGGKLTVSYGNAALLAATDAALINCPYPTSDHGLFVAGIIHTLATHASLHLVEVLDAYAVGTLETIAAGFAKTLDIQQALPSGTALIVNCSLILNIPQDAAQLTQQQIEDNNLADLSLEEAQHMSQLLEDIVSLVSSSSASAALVAASGNDSTSSYRYQPRYPAAYSSVIGVGALNSNSSATGYTNIADQPNTDGYATFGGNVAAASNPPSSDPTDGFMGTYIGTIPQASSLNANGWARWSGTSFATGVISGFLARRIDGGESVAQALTTLENYSTPATTGGIGDITPVIQG